MRESESFFAFFTTPCLKNVKQNQALVRINVCFVVCLSSGNVKDVYVRYCRIYCGVIVYEFVFSFFFFFLGTLYGEERM